MGKRLFIIHGWGGSPQNDWIPWAKKKFEERGYTVIVPSMPDTNNPQINPWVETLKHTVGTPQRTDCFIGHSIGCQTILRYLESLNNQKINKVILVAPWLKLIDLSGENEWNIAKPWLETPIDFDKVKTKAKKFVTIFSDNDPYVPLEENVLLFKERLNSQIIVQNQKNHFNENAGITELPILLKVL